MFRIVLSLLVILLANEEGSAIFSKHFLNIENTISWSNSVLQKGSRYYKMLRESDNQPSLTLNEIFIEVDQNSDKYENFLNILGKKYAERFKTTIEFLENELCAPYMAHSQLNNFINTVNSLYNETRSRIFKTQAQSNPKTLEDYLTQLVLVDSLSVPSSLYKISQTITAAAHRNELFEAVAINDADKFSRLRVCDKYVSNQQSILSIYVNLIITEMKGLATLIYVYSLLQSLNKTVDYSAKLKIAEETFKKHIKNYHDVTIIAIASLPREIYRCDLNPPQRGVNFIEFVHYHRAELISISSLASDGPSEVYSACNTPCEDVDHRIFENYSGLKIYNVRSVGFNDETKYCPPPANQPNRQYLWWRIRGIVFGHNETCPSEKLFANIGWLIVTPHCRTCQCSVIKTVLSNAIDVIRISVSPQKSDIKNNMIVVGVKFVTHERAVHIQIQQGKYLPGEIINNSTVWKKLDDDYQSDMNGTFDYEMLSDLSGQLYLDDVILPPKYVVTGVRFTSRKDSLKGFYLELHGTQIDLQTGELNPESSNWFAASNRYGTNRSDYKRERIEINMDEPDDPSRCTDNDYDQGTNKFVRFTHSSVKKDAGQSTVPYIDAQPVETYPSFPLNGVGLFYRGKEGCGGYIVPRIFTFDVHHQLSDENHST